MNKSKRLNITISFNDEKMYYHVKNQPNSSYYIRELVEKDMESRSQETTGKKIDDISDVAIDILEW